MYKQEKFIFSPTKNYIFSKKEKIIDPKPKYTFHKLSPTQKNYNTFRPVKPFNRFGKSKIYNTGIDPPTIYVDFIKKDPEKPYKRNISPLIANDAKYVPTSPLKWGIGCTKSCNNEYLLPKYDSILFPYLKLKGEFNNTSNSNSFWVPRNNANMSISNKSSVDYNIINNTQNNVSTMRTDMLFNKNLHNKKKGIEEFINTQRPFGPNYNQTFSKLLKENRNRFRNYRGIFTELYDSATKNGNIYKPFHERDEDEFKNKNNKKLNLHKF